MLGTAINPSEPNVTTTEPAMISVAAIVYDTIVLNIPDVLQNQIAKIEIQIDTSGGQQTPPIIFAVPVMVGFSGQQLRVTVPQRNITAIDKSLAYSIKVSDHKNENNMINDQATKNYRLNQLL